MNFGLSSLRLLNMASEFICGFLLFVACTWSNPLSLWHKIILILLPRHNCLWERFGNFLLINFGWCQILKNLRKCLGYCLPVTWLFSHPHAPRPAGMRDEVTWLKSIQVFSPLKKEIPLKISASMMPSYRWELDKQGARERRERGVHACSGGDGCKITISRVQTTVPKSEQSRQRIS